MARGSTRRSIRSTRSRTALGALTAVLVVPGALLALASPVAVASSIAYVAEGGSDTGNDCSTEAAPCATVSHALGQIGAGATIRVSGTIHDNVDVPNSLSPLTITGAGALSPAIIDGSAAGTVIQNDGRLRIEHLQIRNGLATHGGGIIAWGQLVVSHSTITGNVTREYGGGIYVHSSGSAQVLDSAITDNRSTHVAGGGGGIYSNNGPMTILRSTIAGNQAAGPAVASTSPPTTVPS